MTRRAFDCELWIPGVEEPAPERTALLGAGGDHRLEPPPGYGFANYANVFTRLGTAPEGRGAQARGVLSEVEYLRRADELVAIMDGAGVTHGLLGTVPNDALVPIVRRHPSRILGLATFSPFDGMRAVRRFEQMVREDDIAGLHVLALYEQLPASDRRWYPLYAKCVELDVPVRIYSSMNFANDRAYDLGHPRHIDQVAVDFPELRILLGLGGWPWVEEAVALLRRHPLLRLDFANHRPRHLTAPGSGWQALLTLGGTVLQDKVMVGLTPQSFGLTTSEVIDEIEALPLREHVIRKWLHDNAAEFFLGGRT